MTSPETQSLVRNSDSGQLETEPQSSAHQRSTYTEIPIASDMAGEAPPNSPQTTLANVAELQAREGASVHEVEAMPAQPRPSPWSQWWIEIMCCLLMMGTLVAIVITLSHYNGEALPDLPLSVSINTVIAILGTTLKASAGFILAEGLSHLKWQWFRSQRLLRDLDVFDQASRGPWGCAKLLFARPDFLSSFAALLTILTLAMDPFTQQLIRYDGCRPENTNLNATLPRANVYSEPFSSRSFLPEIDRGIFSPSEIKTPFSCPSGNCTFHQPFATFGFCSICEDMTRQLTFTNVSVPVDSFDIDFRVADEDQNFVTIVNATLPSGSFGLSSMFTDPGLFVSSVDLTDPWLDIIQPPTTYPNGRPMFKQHRISQQCQTEAENRTWACSEFGGAGAARCTVRPCVKSYKADVEQGQLREEIVDTHLMDKQFGMMTSTNKDRDERHYLLHTAADLECAGTETVSRLRKEGFSFGNNSIISPWSAAVKTDGGYPDSSISRPLNETNLPIDIIPAQCLYAVEGDSLVNIIDHSLVRHLKGSTKVRNGPSQILALYNDASANFDSINTIFANIAESLTLRVREHDDPEISEAAHQIINKPARGKVLEQKTCIGVRWGYLAYPAALVVLTTTFLSFVVTRALLVDPSLEVAAGWKSSTLPLVLSGLDLVDSEAIKVRVRARDSLQKMEGVADTIKGRLKMD